MVSGVLPPNLHLPTTLLLMAGGLLACFAGYRFFRLVLGVYGFIVGAFFVVSIAAPSTMIGVFVAAVLGGLAGAIILTVGYLVGVALLGAGVGAMGLQTIWTQAGWGDPRPLPLLVAGVVGAALALGFQRYMIIVGTAFAGSWTTIHALLAFLAGDSPVASGAPLKGLARIYSFSTARQGWVTVAWLVLGVAGIFVQLRSKKGK